MGPTSWLDESGIINSVHIFILNTKCSKYVMIKVVCIAPLDILHQKMTETCASAHIGGVNIVLLEGITPDIQYVKSDLNILTAEATNSYVIICILFGSQSLYGLRYKVSIKIFPSHCTLSKDIMRRR